MYNSRIRNFELPENLFSNLGEIKSRKIEKESNNTFIKELKPNITSYKSENEPKLTNYSNRKEYRDRIDKMYEEMKEIKSIDAEIDNILYFKNYIEKGIVVKPKVSSLKQFWTEYRLISNEKITEKDNKKTKKIQGQSHELDNFDQLFEALSQRVSEINKYIDELKEMRASIDISNNKLEKEKEKLSEERKKFLNYKKEEENKLKEEKETLKINFSRLQTIIDDLDKKLVSIDETNQPK